MSTSAAADAPKPRNKVLHIALWVLQVLLALAFVMAGIMKMLTAPDDLVAQGMMWAGRLPAWTVFSIGLLEFLGGVGLVLPAALRILPKLTAIAAACLVLTMVVASAEHAVNAEFADMVPSAVVGVLALIIAVGRFTLAPINPRS
jgi:uncharacterized membrane protein YphA (DoxX/SURF4 family)